MIFMSRQPRSLFLVLLHRTAAVIRTAAAVMIMALAVMIYDRTDPYCVNQDNDHHVGKAQNCYEHFIPPFLFS